MKKILIVIIHIILLILNKFRHVREFHQIVLSGLKEYLSLRSISKIRSILSLRSVLSLKSILSLRSNLSGDLGLNSFESC